MKTNSNYILITLEEINGDYEYSHKSVAEIKDRRTSSANRIAENYAKSFYFTSKANEENGGYYFHGGEVFVRVYSWSFISKDVYNILRKYL
jgi:hypothetical protein